MWLEEVVPEVSIAPANWRPVVASVASRPRTVRRRKPVVAVAELTAGDTGTGEMRRAMAALPRDGSISIRLHGAPDESALKQHLPLTGWELFKGYQMELGKVLDGADVLVCLGGEQRGAIPDVAAAEAAARGLPVIASPALRRHFGSGAIYAQAPAMPGIVKQLHGSAQEYRAASRAALGRAARLHGLQIHQQRIAALIGQPRTAAAPRLMQLFAQACDFSEASACLAPQLASAIVPVQDSAKAPMANSAAVKLSFFIDLLYPFKTLGFRGSVTLAVR